MSYLPDIVRKYSILYGQSTHSILDGCYDYIDRYKYRSTVPTTETSLELCSCVCVRYANTIGHDYEAQVFLPVRCYPSFLNITVSHVLSRLRIGLQGANAPLRRYSMPMSIIILTCWYHCEQKLKWSHSPSRCDLVSHWCSELSLVLPSAAS